MLTEKKQYMKKTMKIITSRHKKRNAICKESN
jgi:hypothetical protein